MLIKIEESLAGLQEKIWGSSVQVINREQVGLGYKIFKVCSSLLLVAGLCWNTNSTENQILNIFIYLTIWGYVLTMGYFVGSTFTLLFSNLRINKSLLLLVFEVAFSFQFCITVLFWATLFPLIKDPTVVVILGNLVVHAMPLLLVILELAFGDAVLRLRSIWLVGLFIVAYLLVNIGVSLGVKPVYPILTYKSLASLGYVLGACALVVGSFLLGVLYSRKRKSHLLILQQQPPAES